MTLLLVTGTRWATIADHGLIVQRTILNTAEPEPGPHVVYVGDARGVDFIADRLFRHRAGWAVHPPFEASWEECTAECPAGHRRRRKFSAEEYCPTAGMRRNRTMVQAFVAAGGKQVLAFPAANVRSSGTTGCIADAKRAGLVVADPILLTVDMRRG